MLDNKKDIRTKGNHTRAEKGVQEIDEAIKHRKTWYRGELHDTGFEQDTRATPAPGTVTAPTTVTAPDSHEGDALEKVCDMIGGKPASISWKDYGRIVAAAYAIGGKDAAYLDRIEHRAKTENELEGLTLDDIFWIKAAAEEKGVWDGLIKAGKERKEYCNEQALKNKEKTVVHYSLDYCRALQQTSHKR